MKKKNTLTKTILIPCISFYTTFSCIAMENSSRVEQLEHQNSLSQSHVNDPEKQTFLYSSNSKPKSTSKILLTGSVLVGMGCVGTVIALLPCQAKGLGNEELGDKCLKDVLIAGGSVVASGITLILGSILKSKVDSK